MKRSTTNRRAVPLQLDGKAAASRRFPADAEQQQLLDSDVAGLDQHNQGFDRNLVLANTPSERHEIKAVATLATGLANFTEQLSQMQRNTSLVIIFSCTPLLGIYAYLSLVGW
jgi:hypothetical protein